LQGWVFAPPGLGDDHRLASVEGFADLCQQAAAVVNPLLATGSVHRKLVVAIQPGPSGDAILKVPGEQQNVEVDGRATGLILPDHRAASGTRLGPAQTSWNSNKKIVVPSDSVALTSWKPSA